MTVESNSTPTLDQPIDESNTVSKSKLESTSLIANNETGSEIAENDKNDKNDNNDEHSSSTDNDSHVENDRENTEENGEERQDIIPDRIFVGNLPYDVTEDEVRNLTPEFDVVSVEIPRKNFFNRAINKVVLQSKGYGFITYTNADDAKHAIDSIEGKAISGREIYAKYALPQKKDKFKNSNQNLNHTNSNQFNNNFRRNNGNGNGFYPPPGTPNFNPHFNRGPPPPGGFYYAPAPPAGFYQPPPSGAPGGVFKLNPQAASFFPSLANRNIKPFYPTPIIGQHQQQHIRRSKEEKQKKLEKGIPSTTTVFVGNLERDVTVDDIREFMKELNPQWIKVPRKTLPNEVYRMLKANGVQIQNKGIAFVRFENEENQKKAIELFNGKEWNGKKLNVTIAINSNDEEENEEGTPNQVQHESIEIKMEGSPEELNDAVNDIIETAVIEAEEDDEDDDIEIEVNVSDSSNKEG